MKSLFLFFIFYFLIAASYAQAPDAAQIERLKKMAEGMSHMTPQQMARQQDSIMKVMKNIMNTRDSIQTDVLTKTAQTLPNGDQLLIKHHYDTGYTKVTFLYTYTESSRSTKSASEMYFSYGGSNLKAPKIYEANGHFTVATSSVSTDADTKLVDTIVNNINRDKPYMDPSTAQKNIDVARQASFSTMVVHDHGLQPSVNYTAHGNGNCGATFTDIIGTPNQAAFSFDFDPVTNLSAVGLGADFMVGNLGKTWCPSFGSNYEKYKTGRGFNATTDVAKAKMVGQRQIEPSNNGETPTYLKVRKSGGGVSISYQRSKTFIDVAGENNIKESLTAFIGDVDKMYEAIIRPVEAGKFKYDSWLPSGPKTNGSNDKKGDDSLQFYIEIRNTKDTTKLYPGSFTVNWLLDDVTKYPGFCNNYPAFSNNPIIDPDLKFDSLLVRNASFDASSITQHSANSKTMMGNNAFAHIICMDYGAYGKLKAIITMDDGSMITAISPYDKKEYLTIPLDVNDNKIADAWEKKEGVFEKNYPANWDEDELPKDLGKPSERGDGYTLLEEYRGFSANKKHFRTSANTMDLMVCDKIGGRSKDGINMYRGVTGVLVHDDFKIDEFGRPTTDPNEGVDHDKCLNFNFTPETHSVDQHGIVIIYTTEKINYAEAVAKKDAKGEDLDIGTPKNYQYLKISPAFDPGKDGYNEVSGNINHRDSTVTADPTGKAKIISDSYAHTIAHEMLHCSNVRHHGDLDYSNVTIVRDEYLSSDIDLNNIRLRTDKLDMVSKNKLYTLSDDGNLYYEDGSLYNIINVTGMGMGPMMIALQHGQHSGFEDCIMRYNAASAYKKDGKVYLLNTKAGYNGELAGIQLCTSKTGTGVNDKNFSPRPRYGDATLGDCKHQYCINDKYH